MNAPTYINAAHEVLAKSGEALCVAEVAKAAGIPKQSATKLLRELSGLGMIEPEPRAGGLPFYRLIAAPQTLDFATDPDLQYLAPEDYELPPADPVLLAMANRALHEQLNAEKTEHAATQQQLRNQAAFIADLSADLLRASNLHIEAVAEADDLRGRLDSVIQQSIADTAALTAKNEKLHAEIEHLRAERATERQAREALQEQAGDDEVDVKDAAVGYLVRVPKRAPLLRRKPESARAAALSAVRAGAARADVLAVVPIGTARRGAEWQSTEAGDSIQGEQK